VLGWPEPQVALSSQGLVEGGGPSFRQTCLSGTLRSEQLPLDRQAGIYFRMSSSQNGFIIIEIKEVKLYSFFNIWVDNILSKWSSIAEWECRTQITISDNVVSQLH